MTRVYFDWNMFSYLRQKKETEEPYKTLFSIIQRNNNRLLFPYSPAHLQDLKKGFAKSEKAKTNVYEDLKFLQEISQNNCLYEDYKEKRVIPIIKNPIDYFNQINHDKSLEKFDFDTLFTSEDKEISQLLTSYINLLKSIPSPLTLDQINNASEKLPSIKSAFQNTMNENTAYSLFKDISKFIDSSEDHANFYKSARDYSIKEMKIDTDPRNWGNAFDYLDKVLAKQKSNQTFRETVEQNLKILYDNKKLSRLNYFTYYYIALDTYGYHKDKEFSNLIRDATHAYFGAHCAFFVTQDKKTYHKAKAVYEAMNIGTQVCSADEFPIQLSSMGGLYNNTEAILNQVGNIIQYSFIVLKTVDDELNPASVYKINAPLADYFNRMQVSSFNDSTILLFYKKKDNYSYFMFWKEIKSVVNKIVLDFGIDDKLRHEFSETDEVEISENKWQGRIWIIKKYVLDIFYSDELNGLTFRIRINKK